MPLYFGILPTMILKSFDKILAKVKKLFKIDRWVVEE